MKYVINQEFFTQAFKTWQGGLYKDNFSYNGLIALYEYLEEYEDSTSEVIDFDMVAIACEYSEYETLEEIKNNYSSIETMEGLQDTTQVIEFDGGIIIRDF
jgi:hypothetical protein